MFLLWLWIANLALRFGAELAAELERGRQLQAGIAAERDLQLPARDSRGVEKNQARDDTTSRAAVSCGAPVARAADACTACQCSRARLRAGSRSALPPRSGGAPVVTSGSSGSGRDTGEVANLPYSFDAFGRQLPGYY